MYNKCIDSLNYKVKFRILHTYSKTKLCLTRQLLLLLFFGCVRDKKKNFASNYSAYYPFGVDVFLSPRKVNHIARFVELPVISSSGKLPPILVVNVQVLLFFYNYILMLLFFLLTIVLIPMMDT